ncbi:MAG: TraB/GumN family protein [Sphingosinicella sp.]|nr:TraB/GumN family protein [Sphingosinicella sp.]
MIRNLFRRICAIAGAAAVAGCATIPSAPQASAPALWKVADQDTIIYLFGTIHMLPQGHQWRTPLLDQAIASSEELVIETLIGDDPMASAQQMAKLGTSPGLRPVIERVPEGKRDALRKVIAQSKIPEASLNRLETWAAAMVLTSVSFRQMGLDPALGVEKGLEAEYKDNARPIRGLETVEEQLSLFDKLSEDSQRKFLASVVEDPAESRKQFQAMLDGWSRGDVNKMARTFDADLREWPELREALLSRRNANWAKWIDERLDRPGIVMVAVGAGHLAGPESVQKMLEGRGIKAIRIQ